MTRQSQRVAELSVLAFIAALTLVVAKTHYDVGGPTLGVAGLLWLNALGGMTLLAALAVTHAVLRQARPLVLIVLAAFAAGSILGWAIIGPHDWNLALQTKAIEAVLIGVIGAELFRSRAEIRPAFDWLLSISPAFVARLARRAPESEAIASAATPTEE
jgi:hypothetical protein